MKRVSYSSLFQTKLDPTGNLRRSFYTIRKEIFVYIVKESFAFICFNDVVTKHFHELIIELIARDSSL